MHALDVLGDPVRRRVLELLADEDRLAGDVAARVHDEFGISAPAVSQHLKVLRDHGFVAVQVEGNRRRYSLVRSSLDPVDAWLGDLRAAWEQRLDALGTEIARGRRSARQGGARAHDQDERTGTHD